MMRMFLCVMFVFSVACEQESTRPESTPVADLEPTRAGSLVDMKIDLEGPKPISRERLKALWPQLAALTDTQLMNVSNAVNSVPAPCGDCNELPIAHCADRKGVGSCAVVSKLIERAIRNSVSGQSRPEVKASINYPDLWGPYEEKEGLVSVVLYRHLGGPATEQVNATLEALRPEFAQNAELTIHGNDVEPSPELGVRSRPTWFINGHRFRGTQSAETLARFIRLEVLDLDR